MNEDWYSFCFTHRPRFKIIIVEAPLLPVEPIIRHILLHHLVFGVEQHVTCCTRSSVLYIIYWKQSNTCFKKPIILHRSLQNKAKVLVIVLTFIIRKLEVVIHSSYKLLHKEASNAGCQVLLAFKFTFQSIYIEIWWKQEGENVILPQIIWI